MAEVADLKRLLASSAILSPLARWMGEHHDEMKAMLGRNGLARWEAVSTFAAENNLTGTNGRPATPALCKQTWKRVQARIALARGVQADAPRRGLPMPTAIVPTDREQPLPPARSRLLSPTVDDAEEAEPARPALLRSIRSKD